MPIWLQALSIFMQLAPTLESEVESALNEHWGKDHVQQIALGANHLAKIAATIQTVAASQPSLTPSPSPVELAKALKSNS